MPKGIRSLANGGSANPFGGPAITGGAGITPIKMQAAQVRFPSARGPVRRAPEPTTKEILGPLLGFGANSLLSGLGGLFGKDEPETADEYLKSIGVEDAAIEDKSLLSEIDRAQYDAYRVYGAPTEKDSFGLDEIANLAIASQMGRGGPGFIKGVLDSKTATESDRLQTQVKRQAYVNSLLAPISLQHMVLESKEDGSTIIGSYNDSTGKLTDTDGNDVSKTHGPKIEKRTFTNYEDVRATQASGKSVPVRGYIGEDDRLYIHDPRHSKADANGFRAAALGGDAESWVKHTQAANRSLSQDLNDPDYDDFADRIKEIREQDATQQGMVSTAIDALDIIEVGIDDATKAPTTMVAGLLNFGNNMKSEFQQIAGSSGNFDSYFAEEGDTTGLGGSGQASKRLWYAYNVEPKGKMVGKVRQYSKGQLAEIKQAESMFTEVNPAVDFDKLFGGLELGNLAYANVRTKGALLQLAYMAAAANGQTGRTLSDKDLAYHLDMVGYGATASPQTLKDNLIDFIDGIIDKNDYSVAINLNRSYLKNYPIDKRKDYQNQVSDFWGPKAIYDKQERVFRPESPDADENGFVISNVPDWSVGPDNYRPKTFKDRYTKIDTDGFVVYPDIVKWYGYDSPARRLDAGIDQENRITNNAFDRANQTQTAYDD